MLATTHLRSPTCRRSSRARGHRGLDPRLSRRATSALVRHRATAHRGRGAGTRTRATAAPTATRERLIAPAIAARRASRIDAFRPGARRHAAPDLGPRNDAVIAMYHDQGLIPVKQLSVHEAVNVTLGLPFIRTSPDHGTAYDVTVNGGADPQHAGRGRARAASSPCSSGAASSSGRVALSSSPRSPRKDPRPTRSQMKMNPTIFRGTTSAASPATMTSTTLRAVGATRYVPDTTWRSP